MPGNTLLEEVISWDFDQCREAVNDVLPQLLILLQETDDTNSILDCLHILCNSFLTYLPTEDIERSFITTVIPKISDTFERSLGDINSVIENSHLSSDQIKVISSSLKIIHQIFNNILSCLQFLNNKATVMLENIYNLPENVTQLLKRIYFHIKESETTYAEYLEELAEPLRNIIKLANAIQTQFLKLMENVTPCLTIEKDAQIITNCCEALVNLAQVAYTLDFKIVISIWKTYIRLIIQWKTSIMDRLDVAESIKFLSNKTEEETEMLFSLISDPKEFSRIVKTCNFNLKIIISICDEFCNYLGDCVTEVIHLILVLYKLSPPFLDNLMPQEQSEEVHRSIVVGIEPLISSLLTDRQFIYNVTKNGRNSFTNELEFSCCMLNLFILQKLPTLSVDIQTEWIKPSNLENSIMYVVFSSVQRCSVEMCLPVFLPGIVSYGKSQNMISFYEYVRINICSFISSLTAQQFSIMEKILFDLAIRSSGIFSVLISDLWCFIARYGTEDLCYSHCCLLADIVKMACLENRIIETNIRNLLGRIVKFLAPKHKISFMEKYPVEENMNLWSCLPINILLTKEPAKDHLLCHCIEQLRHSYKEEMTKEKYLKLCNLLDITTNILHKYNGKVSQQQLQIILNWFQILSTDNIASTPAVQSILGKLIILMANALPFLEEHQLHQTLEYLFQMWTLQSEYIHIAIIQFLKQWKNKYVSPSVEQSQIFSKLARLFSHALKSSNPILHYEALCTFTVFALTTPHAAVIPDCSGGDQQVQSCVQRFITSIASTVLKQNDVILILRKQQTILQERNSLSKCNVKDSNPDSVNNNGENTEHKHIMVYDIINILDNHIKKLENIKCKQEFPEEIQKKLKILYNDIGHLCK